MTSLSPFAPTNARFFDLIDKTLRLTAEEVALLDANGFVVSDRLSFEDFTTAYAYLHWKDLPVLITTDSILHAVHQTYNDLLMLLEQTILTSKIVAFLSACRQQIRI